MLKDSHLTGGDVALNGFERDYGAVAACGMGAAVYLYHWWLLETDNTTEEDSKQENHATVKWKYVQMPSVKTISPNLLETIDGKILWQLEILPNVCLFDLNFDTLIGPYSK